jgi:hypothetical protein
MSNYYKYLPIERKDYFASELLRFTQPNDLNDPFECLPQKPTFEELKNLINSLIPPNADKQKELKVRELYDSAFLDNLYKTQCEKVNYDIGIFSLSKNWNNSLMWAHYTISHKGICIGFDSKHNYFSDYISSDGNSSKIIKEVVYSENRVKIPMVLGQEKLNYEPYITKSMDWKYEEEIRIISSLNLSNNIISKKPFDIHLFKIPHNCINEIILGANIELQNEKEIRNFALGKNIKIYKAKISDKEYDMERE